ncbi:Short-chain dehydrogenase [Nocardioides sp. YR527]|uniref:SDR family oxidoreductase n=1 Tax=Nocardioides sp. YR527 TaxID=1881028 RepID=UPI000889DAF1|nr:SDR family oxidoreductase [Nocardioides sp. YR527]SDJ70444.1 Short-chain dehydrogenase [Nocardioides sp. YR527]
MARTRGNEVNGKVVAITGAARGIGRATAEAFLAAGAKVAIGDLDADLAARTAAELEGPVDVGTRVVGLPLDVTEPVSFAAFLDAAEAELGPLDVLVNNAGIMPTGLFAEEDPAMTGRILGINLGGVINGSRLAAERFTSRGTGHLVNIASLAGVSGFPGLATYCASKHAVVGFTESLHRELAVHGVGVTAVLPGVVRTELSAGANTPAWTEAITTVDPEDVARAIVRVVGSEKPLVTVPRSLGVTLTAMSLLPYRLRGLAEKATGASTAYTQADPVAREAYHQRLRRQA